MSSGGMDWAYRMIACHKLDALGLAVVLHLGWRDVASLRTNRGIARALGQHVTSIARATAKLAALGLIERRSGQWVACETVAIVQGSAAAPKPDLASTDLPSDSDASGGRVNASGVRLVSDGGTPQAFGGERLRRSDVNASGVHKRKENIDKREGSEIVDLKEWALRSVSSLSPFQRSRVLSGQSLVVGGVSVAPVSPRMDLLRSVVRSQAAMNGGVC